MITKDLAVVIGVIIVKIASRQLLGKEVLVKKRKRLGQKKTDLTLRKRLGSKPEKDLVEYKPKKRQRLGKEKDLGILKSRKRLGSKVEKDSVSDSPRMSVLICCAEHLNQDVRIPEQVCKHLSARPGKCYGCTSWQSESNRMLTGYGKSQMEFKLKPRGRLGK